MKELKELGFEYLPTLNELITNQLNRPPIPSNNVVETLCRWWCEIRDYKKLIDQKPKLGDFIPCINGVPVDEPKMKTKLVGFNELEDYYDQFEYEHYLQALERVKFECKKELGTYWVSGEKFQFMVETVCKCPTYEHAINEGVKFKIK